MAWGKGGSLTSCDAILKRVENNDPKLTELIILPMKTFGPDDLERLSKAIANGSNTNLKSISASGHHLPPEALERFGVALSAQAEKNNEHGITSLAIGSKDMGDEGVIALCKGLEESNGGLLQSVDFGWKNIGKEGVKAIGKTFAASKSLAHIDLSRNNDIGDEGMARFAKSSKESIAGNYDDAAAVAFSSLEKLILSECNIGPSGVQSLAEIILGDNATNDRVKLIELAMNSNPIGSAGCGTLSTLCAIPGRGSVISHLQITKCSVGDEGIRLLSNAAAANPCVGLKILDLSDNSIKTGGAETFAKSLAESWPDLVDLKLAKNDLGGDGVTSVMGSLVARRDGETDEDGEKNSALQSLDLSCTNCGEEGAKAVLMSGALKTIRIFDNKLGSDGFNAISPLLKGGHPSIENLDIGGQNAGEEAVVALLNSIADTGGEDDGAAPSKLRVLEIGGNEFSDEAMEALTELQRVFPLLDVAHDKPVQQAEEDEISSEQGGITSD